MNELDKIKELLSSEDSVNRELGILTGYGIGLSINELAKICSECFYKKFLRTSRSSHYKFVYILSDYRMIVTGNAFMYYNDKDNVILELFNKNLVGKKVMSTNLDLHTNKINMFKIIIHKFLTKNEVI